MPQHDKPGEYAPDLFSQTSREAQLGARVLAILADVLRLDETGTPTTFSATVALAHILREVRALELATGAPLCCRFHSSGGERYMSCGGDDGGGR